MLSDVGIFRMKKVRKHTHIISIRATLLHSLTKHLCSNNNRASLATALVNDILLKDWNVFRWALHTQISTSHHDTVAKFYNLFKIVTLETRWLFNFGHDAGREVTLRDFGCDNFFDLQNVFGALHKGKSNPVHTNLEHVIQIGSVLGCQATDLQDGIGGVDTLAVADFPTNNDLAVQVVFPSFDNLNLDFSIINHQLVANFGRRNNLWVWQLHATAIALGLVQIKAEKLSLLQDLSLGV